LIDLSNRDGWRMPHRQHSIRDSDSLNETGVFLARNTLERAA